MKNVKGKKQIENWILTTTWTARAFIIQLLKRPFRNQFESFPFSLSLLLQIFLTSFFYIFIICHLKCDLKKYFFSYSNEMRLTKEKKSTYIVCVFFLSELDLQKEKCRFLRKFIFFIAVRLLSFSANEDAFWFNWTKYLENHETPHQNCTA